MTSNEREATGVTHELLAEISDAFNSHDADRIASFFHEDAVFHMARGPEPDGRPVKGRAAIRKVLADRFEVIPDMRWEHIDEYITGNRAVTIWRVEESRSDFATPPDWAGVVRGFVPGTPVKDPYTGKVFLTP